jgi:hypothetical protein
MFITRTLLSDKEKDEHMIWVLYPLIPMMIFIWRPLWFTLNSSSSRVRNYSSFFSLQLKININRKAYEYMLVFFVIWTVNYYDLEPH